MSKGVSTTRDWPKDTRSLGFGWLSLCVVLAVHVADEAFNDFLGMYNPAVLSLRSSVPWLRLPTFSFPVWISLLALAVIALLCLTSYAFRGSRGMRPLAYIFSAIMLINGIGHLAAAAYTREAIPGVYSSPLVLVAAAYLWYANRTKPRRSKDPDE